MKNHIFIQARQGSKRFSDKILKKICGESIVTLMLERIRKIQNIDDVFLVTGPIESNKQVISEFKKNGIESRPIISGNFTKQECFKNHNFKTNGRYSGADKVEKLGFFIGLPTRKIKPNTLEKLCKHLLKISNL